MASNTTATTSVRLSCPRCPPPQPPAAPAPAAAPAPTASSCGSGAPLIYDDADDDDDDADDDYADADDDYDDDNNKIKILLIINNAEH